jgi:hypothetical protein
MRRAYKVMLDRNTNMPYANVAHGEMWELVEYLSVQRTAVSYSYCETHFTVRFLHLDGTQAQELLDEWTNSEGCEYESSQSAFVHSA